ncbi:MAG: hypothetical protein JWO68_4125 [Actinomycetia bacterium]|nr:hypothetical protein [Actinomycetes bacterium]
MSPFLGPLERLILIRDGIYSTDPRCARRAAMLLALDRGATPSSIARGAGCHRTTVYYWLRLYKEYRDPAVLSGGEPQSAGVPRPGDRAAAVLALRPEPLPRGARPARAPLDPLALAALQFEAEHDPRPRRRLASAIAVACERGVPASKVALAAGMSRQAAYRAWARRSAPLRAGEGAPRIAPEGAPRRGRRP